MSGRNARKSGREDPRDAVLRLAATLLLAGFLSVLPSLAFPSESRGLSGFEHTNWTDSEGAPGQVSNLAQTTDGYLWLATGGTLFRFDGLLFERFGTAGYDPFPEVSALAAHPDGSLWIGLRWGGLLRLSNGRTSAFGPAQGLPAGVPYDLAVDSNGIVVAAIGDRLVTGSEEGWRIHAPAGIEGNPTIRNVLVDRAGGAWAGGARLWYRPPGHAEFSPSAVPVHGVTALAQAPDGTVWAAESTSGTIQPVTPSRAEPISAARYPHPAAAMVFDQDGGLWIGTTGAGVHYAPTPGVDAGPAPPALAALEGISGKAVGSVLTDREGNLWFGTNAGLDRFRKSDLIKVGFPDSAYNLALAIDSGGAVWAGSMSQNAMRLEGGDLATFAVPHPITVAYRNPDGHVWLAGPSGFWRSRGADIEHIMDLPEGVDPSSVVRAVVEDGQGQLWASIDQHGLFRRHAGAWSQEPAHGVLPSQKMPVRAVMDRDGTPWFGYRDNLLVNLRDGHAHRWGPREGLTVGHVTSLLFADSGLWVGGSRGLSFFNGESFVPMRFAGGYHPSGIHGMVRTVTGELWLHGNEGLFRLEADQVQSFLKNPSHQVRPRALGPLEPLAGDLRQVRPLPTALASDDGNIWVATSVGVRSIDPRRLATAQAPPPAHVVSVRADDGPLQTRSGAVLPVLVRRVVIAYTATGLKTPEMLRFRHRLRGHDDAWSQPVSGREVAYIGLPPGLYVFELSAAYGDGPWSPPGTMQFEIPPALHQTTLFIALCAAAAVLLLWFAFRLRVRHIERAMNARLEERHRERDRIARELHDTLLQSVHGLMLRFQAASNRLPADEPARKALELALDQAEEVMIEGRDRVIDLRVPQHHTGELAQSLAAIGTELAAVHGVQFQATTRGESPTLPPEVEKELLLIAREGLINAFRHANANRIDLETCGDAGGMRLRIRDDGGGMPAAVILGKGRAGHWGVIGMRERAEVIGAHLEIRSRQGSGTEVDINLPREHLRRHVRAARGWRRWFRRQG